MQSAVNSAIISSACSGCTAPKKSAFEKEEEEKRKKVNFSSQILEMKPQSGSQSSFNY